MSETVVLESDLNKDIHRVWSALTDGATLST